MSTEAAIALVALEVGSDLLMAYFRLLEISSLTAEEKEAHYQATRVKYYASLSKPVTKPPEK